MAAHSPQVQTVALLDYDPDLGRELAPERLAAAQAHALVTLVRLPRGHWNVAALAERCPYGLLLLDGLVSREVLMSDTTSMQLLGRGELLQPDAPTNDGFVDVHVAWHVLEPAAVALLDARFLAAVRQWPEIVAALFERLAAQSTRLGTQRALCQLPRVEDRILALLWFLAERWGRITPQGVIVPLRLTHDAIGRLVGAKRPTVSLAVRLLDQRGAVHRRGDGAWLLGEPVAPVAGAAHVLTTPGAAAFVEPESPPPAPPASRTPPVPSDELVAVGGDQPGLAPPVAGVGPLLRRTERMRVVHAQVREDCVAAQSRAAATRAHSVELRARIRAEAGRDDD